MKFKIIKKGTNHYMIFPDHVDYEKAIQSRNFHEENIYATIQIDCDWSKMSKFNVIKSTLHHIRVPYELQGQGIGILLFKEILKFMEGNNIKEIWFENYNRKFWGKMKTKYYNNIKFKDNRKIGVIRTA